MSLSFVSSAVLSSSDGVSHNEEKAIETTETQSLRSAAASGAARPLFEQLRANRDADQEKRDEAAKALRGTRTLDEEDCAHLDAVERVRLEREAQMKSEVEDEVAAFRAARADRRALGVDDVLMDDGMQVSRGDSSSGGSGAVEESLISKAPNLALITPKITVKKRRRRREDHEQTEGSGETSDAGTKRSRGEGNDTAAAGRGSTESLSVATVNRNVQGGTEAVEKKSRDSSDDNDSSGGLEGLLGGYGSESD